VINNRFSIFTASLVAIFTGLVVLSQLSDYKSTRFGGGSIIGAAQRAQSLAGITNIMERDQLLNPAAASDRYLDLMLPKDARVFMTGIAGERSGNYYYMVYYLFPREVSVSIGAPIRFNTKGIDEQPNESDADLLAHGFDFRIDLDSNAVIHTESLRPLKMSKPANPEWFGSKTDTFIAFVLPLLTAISGRGLLRILFVNLPRRLSATEELACGFGIGAMAVAALTLGMKLCGIHGHHLILFVTGTAAVFELRRDRKAISEKFTAEFRHMAESKRLWIFFLIGLAVFLILFRLACLQGIIEFDAVAAWLLKAKILHLYAGSDVLARFSDPRLAYAHLDYPTLVPSLHAATFDSIGHANEFITKFWPAWMLLFLIGAVASSNKQNENSFPILPCLLVGLLLLPVTLIYGQMEGGTIPMTFFTALGILQCVRAQMEDDAERFSLGLTLLFGAAMSKFEGAIILATVIPCSLLVRSIRPPQWRQWWRPIAFCVVAALPFAWLRIHIPVLHWESGWAHLGLGNIHVVFSSLPKIFAVVVARLFLSKNFASWTVENGHIYWIGKWEGVSSLYHHATIGLAWFCLLLTIGAWFARPERRRTILWIASVPTGFVLALSAVFACLVNAAGLSTGISGYTGDLAAGRYLVPILISWAIAIMVVSLEKSCLKRSFGHFSGETQ
jgi:hypothetical protein